MPRTNAQIADHIENFIRSREFKTATLGEIIAATGIGRERLKGWRKEKNLATFILNTDPRFEIRWLATGAAWGMAP